MKAMKKKVVWVDFTPRPQPPRPAGSGAKKPPPPPPKDAVAEVAQIAKAA